LIISNPSSMLIRVTQQHISRLLRLLPLHLLLQILPL
jgi:hypothetical protein